MTPCDLYYIVNRTYTCAAIHGEGASFLAELPLHSIADRSGVCWEGSSHAFQRRQENLLFPPVCVSGGSCVPEAASEPLVPIRRRAVRHLHKRRPEHMFQVRLNVARDMEGPSPPALPLRSLYGRRPTVGRGAEGQEHIERHAAGLFALQRGRFHHRQPPPLRIVPHRVGVDVDPKAARRAPRR